MDPWLTLGRTLLCRARTRELLLTVCSRHEALGEEGEPRMIMDAPEIRLVRTAAQKHRVGGAAGARGE